MRFGVEGARSSASDRSSMFVFEHNVIKCPVLLKLIQLAVSEKILTTYTSGKEAARTENISWMKYYPWTTIKRFVGG